MITIYGMTDSGNCYKPRLLMAMLGRPFRHVEVNSLSGVTREPAFLAKNRNGKVTLLELEDGRRIAEADVVRNRAPEQRRSLWHERRQPPPGLRLDDDARKRAGGHFGKRTAAIRPRWNHDGDRNTLSTWAKVPGVRGWFRWRDHSRG